MRDEWNGLKTRAGHYKSKLNSSNKQGDKLKEAFR